MSTDIERQAAVVQVLILMEPSDAHDDKCPAKKKKPTDCVCHLIRNTRTRAAGLGDAGLLRALKR